MAADIVRQILERRPWLAQPNMFSFGFSRAASEDSSGEREIGERLIAAYRKAIADGPYSSRPIDMWSGILDRWYGEFVALIMGGDPIALTTYLRSLPRQPAGHGYFQGRAAFESLVSDTEAQRRRAIALMDYLAGMAEAVCVLSVCSPEQLGWEDFSGSTARELHSAIQRKTGVPISLPPIFDGLFALEPETGPLHLRTVMAGYAVQQLSILLQELAEVAPSELRIAEIGAGIGFTAFAAQKLGFAQYDVFDIPEVNVAQGYFLLKALPASEVALYGEGGDRKAVSVLPAFIFHAAPSKAYHATMNIDSLPEIAKSEVERYLITASRCSQCFFSINQESQAMQSSTARQLHVHEVVLANGSYRPILRFPNWIRPGYVEELWRSVE
jgi:hypothetical protein